MICEYCWRKVQTYAYTVRTRVGMREITERVTECIGTPLINGRLRPQWETSNVTHLIPEYKYETVHICMDCIKDELKGEKDDDEI